MSVMDIKIKVLPQSTKNDWYWAVLDSLVNTHSNTKVQCSALAGTSTARPYMRKLSVARRSSRSMLARKDLWSSASTELPPDPRPFSSTTADWHSSQSDSSSILVRSKLANTRLPHRLMWSMLAATRALGRCKPSGTLWNKSVNKLLYLLSFYIQVLLSFSMCKPEPDRFYSIIMINTDYF